MSDYEDAVESAEDSSPTRPISKSALRHRPTPLPLWDPDDLSLSEEVPGFNEVKVKVNETGKIKIQKTNFYFSWVLGIVRRR